MTILWCKLDPLYWSPSSRSSDKRPSHVRALKVPIPEIIGLPNFTVVKWSSMGKSSVTVRCRPVCTKRRSLQTSRQ